MILPEVTVAQIDTVYPEEGRIAIVFPTQAMLSGIKVKLAAEGASARTGLFRPLQRGDWGLVTFYQNDPRACVWLKSLPDDLWHSYPAEIMTEDPLATVEYEHSGVQRIRFSNGDEETLRPDGTLIRITHSVPDIKAKKTPRKVSEPDSDREPQRKDYTPPKLPPAVLYVEHASGTKFTLDEKGNLEAETAGGMKVRMDDEAQTVSTNAPTIHNTADKIIEEASSVLLGGPGASKTVVLNGDTVTGTIIDGMGRPCTFTLKVVSSASKTKAQ